MANELTFYYAPQTRSLGTLALLEELGAEYDLHVLDMKGATRTPEYLAVNPMGKVPALRHGDVLVTEQPAIMMYLAELFPDKGLSPKVSDPARGPYLRWMTFYGSSFEPAILDRSMKGEPAPRAQSPYGDYDTTIKTLYDQLARGPYITGERFTAADVLWGVALRWITSFKLAPDTPVVRGYIERVTSRPAIQRATAKDEELAEKQR